MINIQHAAVVGSMMRNRRQDMTQRWTHTFGHTLRSIRMMRGLTMDAIAEKSGHNQSSLSVVERDKSMPSAAFLRDVAPFYGCPWWSQTHNVSWLTMIATATARTDDQSDPNALHVYLDLGVQTKNLLTQAMAQDPSVAPLYRQCLEFFGLPGLTSLSTVKTAPLWAWVAETVVFDEHVIRGSDDANVQAKRLLAKTLAFFRENRMDVNQPNIARDLRAARLARQWSCADLARRASKQLQLAGEPPLRDIDIEQMESEVGELNIVHWSALAHVLELPLSQIMPSLTASSADDIEAMVMQLLKQYGLSPRAINALKGMMQLLKSYEDHALVRDS